MGVSLLEYLPYIRFGDDTFDQDSFIDFAVDIICQNKTDKNNFSSDVERKSEANAHIILSYIKDYIIREIVNS
jgi:hypothetical protein